MSKSSIEQNIESRSSKIESILSSQEMSLSTKIRSLYAIVENRSIVAQLLSTETKTVRYQHVRNVLITPLKKT